LLILLQALRMERPMQTTLRNRSMATFWTANAFRHGDSIAPAWAFEQRSGRTGQIWKRRGRWRLRPSQIPTTPGAAGRAIAILPSGDSGLCSLPSAFNSCPGDAIRAPNCEHAQYCAHFKRMTHAPAHNAWRWCATMRETRL